MFFFVYEGPTDVLDAPNLWKALLWSAGLGLGVALFLVPTALPIMRTNVLRLFNDDGTRKVHPVRSRHHSMPDGVSRCLPLIA